MAKRIAIVILNWNGVSMLRKYLPGVISMSEDMADVWVADNASADNSMKWVAENCPTAKTILLDKNYGFAEGYNKALEKVDAEYYVLLNSDVEVTEGWLRPLVGLMDSDGKIAACQPKLLAIHDRAKFEYAGASGGFVDKYGYPFCRGRVLDMVETDNGQYDDVAEIHWATGACLMIRKQCYWLAGGLDGRFFAHNEEIDLCWRLRLLGYRIMVQPASRVFHVGGGTLSKGNPMKTYLNFRNNLTMLYKNLPSKDLRHVMRVRCVLDYVAAAKMLILERNVEEAKAVLRGRRDFKKWRRLFDEDRQLVTSPNHHDAPLMPFCILWRRYFGKTNM